MAIEVLVLAAGIGATYGWWALQRRRDARVGLRMLESAFDGDANVAFGVASHAMTSRGHAAMVPLHLLYGLLQDETFTAALAKVGGNADEAETRVLAALDEPFTEVEDQARFVGAVLSHAYGIAQATKRKISIIDLWAPLSGVAFPGLAGVDSHALLFQLVHGMPAPAPELPGRTDVHIILRNDDYTTQLFVSALLREEFGLADEEAETRMMETHTQGKSIVGRYKHAAAHDKVIAARERAKKAGYPLWIALEDC